MNTSSENPREPSLGQLLGRVCRLVGKRRRMKLESIGLHHAQGMILSRLWQENGLSQRALAEELHIAPPTASNTLQRMERDGWIARRRDASDQRIVRVYLTDKAQALHEEARASFRELDYEMGSALSSEEQETLRQSLMKVYRYLEQETACCAGKEGDR